MDIGSLYSDYLTSTATSASNLQRTLEGTKSSSSTDDELLDACKQFESYFYEQIFKNMEKAMVPSDDSDANNTLIDYYKENLISEYSKEITNQQGDNSLAQQLYEQMKRNMGTTDIESLTSSEETEETVASASAATDDKVSSDVDSDTDISSELM